MTRALTSAWPAHRHGRRSRCANQRAVRGAHRAGAVWSTGADHRNGKAFDVTRGGILGLLVQSKTIKDRIEDGTFARNWIAENENGMPEFKAKMNADLEHPIETVGKDLRSRMDWLEG